MMAELEKSKTVYYIDETSGASSYNKKTKTIKWDPNSGVMTTEGHELSATTILNHEVDHALQNDKNPDKQTTDKRTPDAKYGDKEEKRVIEGSEQETAKKLGEIEEGEVTRRDHKGTLYTTKNSTSTEAVFDIILIPEDENN
ncbi:MAG: hypothetical protein KAG37_02450 [Flavobacteriales bacterium]|nr:hypothetical protein [Flavobacteriales bacterium]